ncbi:MAG: ATP-dependent DNA helicase RecG [Gammaproteobacteria bacterium]
MISLARTKPSGENNTSLLLRPISCLKGVGDKMTEKLSRLNIITVQDLLFHLPLRYQDRSRLVPIGALRAGTEVLIQGEVLLTEVKFGGRRTMLSRISDGTGSITLRFFHFSTSQQKNLARGTWVRCFGQVRLLGVSARRNRKRVQPGSQPLMLEMVHPEYKRINQSSDVQVDENLTPIYGCVEGMRQTTLRMLVDQALELLNKAHCVGEESGKKIKNDSNTGLEELLPDVVINDNGFPSLIESVKFIHKPTSDVDLNDMQLGRHPAQKRLAFEELLAQILSLRILRRKLQQYSAPVLRSSGVLQKEFMTNLPFSPTKAQNRVIEEILADMTQDFPMQRLVQGDVGSGKTVVAAAAIVHSIESGFQAAVMAPTELLAEQHFQNFKNWLEPIGIKVLLLTGSLTAQNRRQVLEDINNDPSCVVIGTHALFQQGVEFLNLGLIVVDEQHRFGVHQRLALREKGKIRDAYPHQLIMTATPIPRTLSMTAYADLDISVIDQLPPGRLPVTTIAVSDTRRNEILKSVLNACLEGKQVYWVCPLIEESEKIQCQTAVETAQYLAESFPEMKVGLVHGRMAADEKELVMTEFKNGNIDLLVSTTVIEVGVDVPNASLMIIENAERFGLAQLHQLRGRIGRGADKSTCVLMYHGRLSGVSRSRIQIIRETNDGFEIARKDLEMRGPGELLGPRQAGSMQFRIADLLRDQALIPSVNRAADLIMKDYPQCVASIIHRWLGDASQYGHV